MTVFPIRTFGDAVLRGRAGEVAEIDESIRRLVEDMLETMYEAPGVGLAAPQIGIPKRVIVFDVGEGPHAVINPELVETSGESTFDEGCLSIPGHYWPVTRAEKAIVLGLDLEGREVKHGGDELLGRVLQHEVDHLEGVLLIERLDRLMRKEALRQLRQEALGLSRPD